MWTVAKVQGTEVLHTTRRTTRNSSDAEDLVQDTLIRAFTGSGGCGRCLFLASSAAGVAGLLVDAPPFVVLLGCGVGEAPTPRPFRELAWESCAP
jgi:hypothetical protein